MIQTLWEGRVIAWFSRGVASAVAAKLAVEKYGSRCVVVNNDMTADEHPDNERFSKDVERWLGVNIIQIPAPFPSVDAVFESTRFMASKDGARCSTEMKKLPGREFSYLEDVHVYGYPVDEQHRIKRFERNNPELRCEWPLVDAGLTKADCFRVLSEAGIRRSAMYDLGYKNANCYGCVKATSPTYWNRVRRDRPDVFELRAKRGRELGVRLVQYKGNRIFLDELDPNARGREKSISCGPSPAPFRLADRVRLVRSSQRL